MPPNSNIGECTPTPPPRRHNKLKKALSHNEAVPGIVSDDLIKYTAL